MYSSVLTIKLTLIKYWIKYLLLLFTDVDPFHHILWKKKDRLFEIIHGLIYEACSHLDKEIIVPYSKKILHLLK